MIMKTILLKMSPETCIITNYENEQLSHWAKMRTSEFSYLR